MSKEIPHLPRYAITGDAWDTLNHEIMRALRATVTLLDAMRKHLSEHRDDPVGEIG